MDLYIHDATRTLAICSNNYTLVLMDNNTTNRDGSIYSLNHSTYTSNQESITPKCLIEFVPTSSLPLNTFRRIQKGLHGFLGLISLKGTIYFGFISGKSHVGPLVPQIDICRLISTIFVNFSGEVFSLYNQNMYGSHSQHLLPQLQQLEESYENTESSSPTSRINSIMKLLETGTFYYSNDTDLAVKAQDWDTENRKSYSYTTIHNLQDDYAGRFVWNNNLISELSIFRGRLASDERQIFDHGKFYITLIRGFVQRENLDPEGNSWMTLISRQDSRKIGPMFGPACMDDEGNVANFVETEVVVYTGDHLVSFSIIRGNVPLFWRLDSHLLSTKIDFPRSEDASKHAFNRFFETLCAEYNMLHVLDALSTKGSQPELSDRYSRAIKELQADNNGLSVGYKKLTYSGSLSNRLKGKNDYMSLLLQDEQIHTALHNYSTYQFDLKEWKQSSRQLGVFLINTLDSNDRANHIECKLSEMILENLFGSNYTANIWGKHNILWVSNGIALGKLSDSYNGSIKTKNKTGGLIGKFAEQGKKYAGQGKKYVSGSNTTKTSNSGRQNQFDKLLGRKNKELQVELVDPIHDYVLQGLNKRRNEFTTMRDLVIFTVTFNVNAVLFNGDLNDLLFPEEEKFDKYDLIVIALEEVIELTPSKVMSIDLKTRNFWEKRFKETLNNKHAKEYTLLRGEQLGGILLLVYANTQTIDNIKNVETSVKKTGFKGISANKGGVAITFTFSTHSRLCFVASHLAAGQSNSEERHQNYKTIANGLTFKRCKNIKDSDIVIWMGDLNYRISLPNETVRKMLKSHAVINSRYNSSSESIGEMSEDVDGHGGGDGTLYNNDGDDTHVDSESILGEFENDMTSQLFEEDEVRKEKENEKDLETKLLEERRIKLLIENKVGDKLDFDMDLDGCSYKDSAIDLNANVRKDVFLNKNLYGTNDGLEQYGNFEEGLSSNNTSLVNLQSTLNKKTEKTENKKLYEEGQEKSNASYSDLNEAEAKQVISQLFEYDQLNAQMVSGQTFPFFDEMEINFKPTYKFDKGTDYYDTSEKQRVPSWTDRILTHTKNKRITSLEQLIYNSIPKYKFSDHKPVYGIFRAKLEIVDDLARSIIEKDLYEITKQRLYTNENNGGVISPGFIGSLLADVRSSKVPKHGLPAPSSKTSRWWISKEKDGKTNDEKIGKIKIRFPELDGGEYVINTGLPRNPFTKTEEPFFVSNKNM